MIRRVVLNSLVVLSALATGLVPAMAQTANPPAPAAAMPAPGRPGVPPPENQLVMIRTTLIALHQANVTGNYTVLRDLGAPAFQSANSAARLSEVFAGLRSRGVDLAQVVLTLPKLSQPSSVNDASMLRMTGIFDLPHVPVAFDLLYQPVAGQWRLFGISVNALAPKPPAAPQAASAKPPAAANKRAPAKPAVKPAVKSESK